MLLWRMGVTIGERRRRRRLLSVLLKFSLGNQRPVRCCSFAGCRNSRASFVFGGASALDVQKRRRPATQSARTSNSAISANMRG